MPALCTERFPGTDPPQRRASPQSQHEETGQSDLEVGPQGRVHLLTPRPCRCALVGNKVFADVITYGAQEHPGLPGGPRPNDWCPCGRGQNQGEVNIKKEAEAAVEPLHAMEGGQGQTHPPPEPPGGPEPLGSEMNVCPSEPLAAGPQEPKSPSIHHSKGCPRVALLPSLPQPGQGGQETGPAPFTWPHRVQGTDLLLVP